MEDYFLQDETTEVFIDSTEIIKEPRIGTIVLIAYGFTAI